MPKLPAFALPGCRMHHYHHAYTKIETITDPHLQGLFDEIFRLRHEVKD